MYSTHYSPRASPGYKTYEYRHSHGPSVSPSPNASYYSTRYPTPQASPNLKGHSRRASHHDPPQYTHTSPRADPHHGRYPSSSQYYASQPFAPPREADYVSNERLYRSKGRRYSGTEGYQRPHEDRKQSPPSSRYYYTKVVIDDDSPHERSPPPPYEEYHKNYRYWGADQYYHGQFPIYEPQPQPQESAHRSRARRNSHHARPSQPTEKPKPKPAYAKTTPQATEEDARRANIPAGYSYKNWDPTEEPILLLGSVFDANSLGKWIYDWTVYANGRSTPMSDVAGEMWLLLIQLAGKTKRAEEIMPKIRKKEARETIEEFLDSGERLWSRFGKLLKVCEDYMWKAAKEESGERKPASMGQNSGVEFVDSMFGRERELERTEKLMTALRYWSLRFDANCEDILRNPTA